MTTEKIRFSNDEKKSEWEDFFKDCLSIIGKGLLTGASLYCGSAMAGSLMGNRTKSLPTNEDTIDLKKIAHN